GLFATHRVESMVCASPAPADDSRSVTAQQRTRRQRPAPADVVTDSCRPAIEEHRDGAPESPNHLLMKAAVQDHVRWEKCGLPGRTYDTLAESRMLNPGSNVVAIHLTRRDSRAGRPERGGCIVRTSTWLN